jgi:hypothetical protein
MDIATGAERLARLSKFIVLTGIIGLLVSPSGALAAGGLSSVVIAKTFPGMVASMTGPMNGPITESNLSSVIGSNDPRASDFMAPRLANGDVVGYVRVWRHLPLNGESITISAFRFKNPADLNVWLDGQNGEIHSLAGVVTFAVPKVKGASGYVLHRSSLGTLTLEYEVTFVKKVTSFLVNVVSPSGELTSSDVASLALEQAANASNGSSNTNANSKLVTDIASGAAVLVGFAALSLAFLHLRNRRRS